MNCIEDILSRALLVRDRTVPRDIVPPSAAPSRPRPLPASTPPEQDSPPNEAAEDLRALCETLVNHTPATAVTEFVTDQVPEPRSALVLACVLQLTDTDDGARFWWQYAAGAGQAAAAYCLYLHHLALGEDAAADWWHRQTDDVQPAPEPPVQQRPSPEPTSPWQPANHQITGSTSTTTMLRILRHLSRATARPRPAGVTALMACIPTAVAIGYLREPEMELPLPGPDFARRIRSLLTTAAHRPAMPSSLPARSECRERTRHDDNQRVPHRLPATPTETVSRQVGETATR